MIVGRYKGDLCISDNETTIIFRDDDIEVLYNHHSHMGGIINHIQISMDTIELKSKVGGNSKFHITNDGGNIVIFFILDGHKAYYIDKYSDYIKTSDYRVAKEHINIYKVDKSITIKNESNLKKLRDKAKMYANIKIN